MNESKAEADTLRAQSATGSANGDVNQITRTLMKRVRAIEAEMVSKRWNEIIRYVASLKQSLHPSLRHSMSSMYLFQMRWSAFLTGILTHTPDYSVTQSRGRLHGCARTGRSPQCAFYSSIIPRFSSQRHLLACCPRFLNDKIKTIIIEFENATRSSQQCEIAITKGNQDASYCRWS